MKSGILAFLIMTAVSVAFAVEDSQLQNMAESRFTGQTTVEFKKKRTPERSESYSFDQPIDRVVVNSVDNPLRLFGFWSECTGLKLMAVSCAVKEIFLYAGEEQLNCYVRFESEPGKEIKVKSLVECN